VKKPVVFHGNGGGSKEEARRPKEKPGKAGRGSEGIFGKKKLSWLRERGGARTRGTLKTLQTLAETCAAQSRKKKNQKSYIRGDRN